MKRHLELKVVAFLLYGGQVRCSVEDISDSVFRKSRYWTVETLTNPHGNQLTFRITHTKRPGRTSETREESTLQDKSPSVLWKLVGVLVYSSGSLTCHGGTFPKHLQYPTRLKGEFRRPTLFQFVSSLADLHSRVVGPVRTTLYCYGGSDSFLMSLVTWDGYRRHFLTNRRLVVTSSTLRI